MSSIPRDIRILIGILISIGIATLCYFFPDLAGPMSGVGALVTLFINTATEGAAKAKKSPKIPPAGLVIALVLLAGASTGCASWFSDPVRTGYASTESVDAAVIATAKTARALLDAGVISQAEVESVRGYLHDALRANETAKRALLLLRSGDLSEESASAKAAAASEALGKAQALVEDWKLRAVPDAAPAAATLAPLGALGGAK